MTSFRPPERMSEFKNRQYNKPPCRSLSVLVQFYPDVEFAMDDIRAANVDFRYLSRMVTYGYLEVAGEGLDQERYRLARDGQFVVLCTSLGVNIIGACMLARAHMFYKLQSEGGRDHYYPIHDVKDRLDAHQKKTIQNTLYALYSNKLATRPHYGEIRLTRKAVDELAMHEEVLADLRDIVTNSP